MFQDRDHSSYVLLMRDLQLPRKFEEGDWYAQFNGPREEPVVRCIPGLREECSWRVAGGAYIWLPTLNQWMEILDEAGIKSVSFQPGMGWHVHWIGRNASAHAPTRVEAAARLWLVSGCHHAQARHRLRRERRRETVLTA